MINEKLLQSFVVWIIKLNRNICSKFSVQCFSASIFLILIETVCWMSIIILEINLDMKYSLYYHNEKHKRSGWGWQWNCVNFIHFFRIWCRVLWQAYMIYYSAWHIIKSVFKIVWDKTYWNSYLSLIGKFLEDFHFHMRFNIIKDFDWNCHLEW